MDSKQDRHYSFTKSSHSFVLWTLVVGFILLII